VTAFAEEVENPEFTMWSKLKKGTSMTLKTTTSANGMNFESTSTTVLTEVGADKVVLEMTSVSKFNGKDIKVPPVKREVTKTIKLPDNVKKEDLKAGKPQGTYEDGTETLKISGMELKTKWYKFKTEANGVKSEGKMWVSDDVPGLMVKMESSSTGAATASIKMELTEFKKP
jgi:hypothetical protein